MVQVDIPAQPIGDEQTQSAAIARPRAAVALWDANLAVGLEGGLRQTIGGGWALCSWAAVVDTEGKLGVGGGGILTDFCQYKRSLCIEIDAGDQELKIVEQAGNGKDVHPWEEQAGRIERLDQ